MIELKQPTGNRQIDDILRGVIGMMEMNFPNRVRAYALNGSYSTGSSTPLNSDIDLTVVFDSKLPAEDREKFFHLRDYCSLVSPFALDLLPQGLDELTYVAAHTRRALIVYGDQKIYHNIDPMPIDVYLRETTQECFELLHRLRKNKPDLSYPLSYPDLKDPFYGYLAWGLQDRDGEYQEGTRTLINTMALMASVLVAMRTGIQSHSKPHAIDLYEKHVGSSGIQLRELYILCKIDWGYQLPADSVDRERLQTLCQFLLAFENFFLIRVQPMIMADFNSDDDTIKQSAQDRLNHIGYPPNEEVK